MIGMTAVVLAGGPHDELAALTPGAPNKAFVAIGGVPLVERTLRALACSRRRSDASSSSRRRRCTASAALALADECRPDGERIRESLRSGLRDLPADDDVLVSTSDLPVLTAEAVEDYIARARVEANADITYGCVEKARPRREVSASAAHVGALARRHVLRNGVHYDPPAHLSVARALHRTTRPRAKESACIWRACSAVGVLVRFALRRLTIAHAEARASQGHRRTRARRRFAVSRRSAVNVDRLSDVALAESLVRS